VATARVSFFPRPEADDGASDAAETRGRACGDGAVEGRTRAGEGSDARGAAAPPSSSDSDSDDELRARRAALLLRAAGARCALRGTACWCGGTDAHESRGASSSSDCDPEALLALVEAAEARDGGAVESHESRPAGRASHASSSDASESASLLTPRPRDEAAEARGGVARGRAGADGRNWRDDAHESRAALALPPSRRPSSPSPSLATVVAEAADARAGDWRWEDAADCRGCSDDCCATALCSASPSSLVTDDALAVDAADARGGGGAERSSKVAPRSEAHESRGDAAARDADETR